MCVCVAGHDLLFICANGNQPVFPVSFGTWGPTRGRRRAASDASVDPRATHYLVTTPSVYGHFVLSAVVVHGVPSNRPDLDLYHLGAVVFFLAPN